MKTELYQIHNGKLTINLHAGQARAWRSDRRFTFIIAGTQGGKTSFEPIWLDREIEQCGNGDYLAVTATYDLFKLKFLPEMQHWFCDLRKWQYSASDRVIWRQDKPRQFSRIILRSANAPGGLESATAKGAVLDECGQDDFRLESWEATLRRLSLAGGRVLGGTTPYNMGWLKTEIFDRWRAGDPDIGVVQFRSIDNPAFPRAEYDRAKRTLPDWKWQMFYNGVFTRPAGLIYEDFNDVENVCDDFPIPPEWTRWVGVDFGAVHTATVWIAENPDNKALYLYRATLEGGLTTNEHAKRWLNYGERVAAWSGGAPSEDQPRRDFSDAGIPIHRPPIADVEAGIDRVTGVIKTRRLIVFRSLRGVLDELGTYAREIDESGQPTEKIKDKATFHRLDSLRYVVSWITDGGTTEVVDDPFAGW